MNSEEQSRSKNSTNVRLYGLRDKVLRRGFRFAEAGSPQLAAWVAERMFLSPRRGERPAWEADLVATAERASVAYGKLELPTYTWGEGTARVLLLHGWEGRGSQLGAFIPKLLARGYQVIAVDLPGHGEAAPALTSVVDFGRAVATVIQRLGPFAGVIGHSMGASAAALAYTFAPFDARLVLIGAPQSPRRFFDGFTQQLGISRRTKELVEARIEQRFGLAIDRVDVRRLGASIDVPTLVIHDRDDKIVPFEHGLALAAALPQASLVATERLGHRRILRDEDVVDAAVSFIVHDVRNSWLNDAPQAA